MKIIVLFYNILTANIHLSFNHFHNTIVSDNYTHAHTHTHKYLYYCLRKLQYHQKIFRNDSNLIYILFTIVEKKRLKGNKTWLSVLLLIAWRFYEVLILDTCLKSRLMYLDYISRFIYLHVYLESTLNKTVKHSYELPCVASWNNRYSHGHAGNIIPNSHSLTLNSIILCDRWSVWASHLSM